MVSNEEMEDVMKIVKSLKESTLLIKRIDETIKNKAKEQISFNLIKNISFQYIRKYIKKTRSNKGRWNNYWSRLTILRPPYPLTNFEIQNYLRNNLPKMNQHMNQ